ncbi:MAG TPA: hypothetical protein DCZ95_03120 [Verrucomicrobia bacterium]|nr:MAG: hypothetical protein A2X46_02295 [Lentisphaerae bacterium GWF2_57_35]HBA83064.1 hypothetical protein [Verrucomicrobiota bacterium]
MGKRERNNAVNLDSFLDIMTCILGILILMILLTGIDASQIRVLVPTPMEHTSDKRPIFIECRDNELFSVPLEELRKLADTTLKQIARSVSNDSARMLIKLGEAKVQTEAYRVDLNFILLGQLAVQSVPNVTGYRLVDIANETSDDWYGRILTQMNKEKDMLSFIVRDDSFEVFKRARALAWSQKAEVSYELIDANEPIKFGLGGAIPLAQ